MTVDTIGIESIREAARLIEPYLHRTPTVRSTTLSRQVGADVALKLELFQKTGSFKPRGALTNMLSLPAASRERGVITISAGNHAQGVAYAAQQLGVAATVVMPAAASPMKAAAARAYGAEVILHGDVHQAFEKVRELEVERNLTFVHPFDHPRTIAGQGTVGLEVMADVPDADVIVVPVGGGGLIAGVALAVKALRPATRIIGVEPQGASAMIQSRAAGSVVHLDRVDTIADGLAPPFVGELNFEIAERHVDELVAVDDATLVRGMHFLLTRVKVMAEPAGAAAVAALLSGQLQVPAGRVVCIVSGGNFDPARFPEIFRESGSTT